MTYTPLKKITPNISGSLIISYKFLKAPDENSPRIVQFATKEKRPRKVHAFITSPLFICILP